MKFISAFVSLLFYLNVLSCAEVVEYPFMFGDGSSTSCRILYKGEIRNVRLAISDQKYKTALASLESLDLKIRMATFTGPTTRLYVIGSMDDRKQVLYVEDWFLLKPFYILSYDPLDTIKLEANLSPDFKIFNKCSVLSAGDFTLDNPSLGVLSAAEKEEAAKKHLR